MKKYIFRIMGFLLRRKGYSGYSSLALPPKIWDELFHNKKVPFRKRLWALRKGFFADKLSLYNLNEENYKDYLSDLDYEWLHPLNGLYSHWIDDKLTFRYLLEPFHEYLPAYYYHLTEYEIMRLVDCPDKLTADEPGILSLIKLMGVLAVKPVIGTGGSGFYKFSYANEEYYINDQLSSDTEIRKLIHALRLTETGYLLTEYIKPHKDFARIWEATPNTLRVTVYKEPGQKATITYAFTRFGTNQSGLIDNTLAGGMVNLIDIESGYYTDGQIFVDDKMVSCKLHPDNGVLVEGTVPHWQLIKDKIYEMCDFLPQLRYIGFDIAVVDQGFKILEINSLPSVEAIQCFKPIFNEKVMGSFFRFMLAEKRKKIGK